jgi:MiaB/RimO family radical SAM methylthiotransferase
MAQRYPEELAESIPEADAIVGFDAYPRLPGLVRDVAAGRPVERVLVTREPEPVPARRSLPLAGMTANADRLVLDLAVQERAPLPVITAGQDGLDRIPSRSEADGNVPASGPAFPIRAFDGAAWAYLKIASGCDRACTFCAIPSFRGSFRSRPADELCAEAGWLAGQGAKELVLVSENTTSWGKDLGGRSAQPDLLRRLSDVEGIERLRLMYLQPAEITWPLLEAMATLPKVASYFDLSLQHVAPGILRRMKRGGSPEHFLRLIGEIRALDPNAVFRSNFICGFPGETDADADLLADFLEEARLDWVGLFTFSVEDGTASATMPDQVDHHVALERMRTLSSLQESIADAAAAAFVGRTLDVLVEECDEDVTVGRSYREAPDTDGEVRLVTADGRPADLPIGRRLPARVAASDGVDLVATVGP